MTWKNCDCDCCRAAQADGVKEQVEALQAENRVVRELVEDALDHLWRHDKEGYQVILDRCTWMMGEEQPLDAEAILNRLGICIEVGKVATGVWKVRMNDYHVGIASFESTAIEDAKILSEIVARAIRQATDPLLARIAALQRRQLKPIKERLEQFRLEQSVLSTLEKEESAEALTFWIEETFKETP